MKNLEKLKKWCEENNCIYKEDLEKGIIYIYINRLNPYTIKEGATKIISLSEKEMESYLNILTEEVDIC
jgi:hypothetical protein